MKRKPDKLIPIEEQILAVAQGLLKDGQQEFHGYQLAVELQGRTGARRLAGHGTLYKALLRLERQGFLLSHWEDPTVAGTEGRRQRRLYRLSLAGAQLRLRRNPQGQTTHVPAIGVGVML
jgi:DNA-binding PadR family transcriptional regulator